MKTTTAFKLLAIALVFIFTIGPATASTGVLDKSSILSGYKSSSGYSQIKSNNYASIVKPYFSVKPDINVISNPSTKPDLNLFKNMPLSWDPSFMAQTKKSQSVSSLDWNVWFTPNTGGCGSCSCGG